MVTVINAYLKAITNRQTERQTDRGKIERETKRDRQTDRAITEQRQWVEGRMNLKRDHRQRRQVNREGAKRRGETEKKIGR